MLPLGSVQRTTRLLAREEARLTTWQGSWEGGSILMATQRDREARNPRKSHARLEFAELQEDASAQPRRAIGECCRAS